MVKFATVDMSLDDFILKKKKNKNSIGKRSTGNGGGGAVRRPAGHWRGSSSGIRRGGNDYIDVDAPDNFSIIGGANRTVRVNISNLAPSVISGDLEELFGEFGIDSAVVNYNEHGESLGTGDVVLKKREAEKLIKKFSGVALDGNVLKFVLVEDDRGIASRVDFGAKRLLQATSSPFSNSRRGGRGRVGNGLKRSEDFLRRGVHEGNTKSEKRRGGGGGGGGGGKRFNDKSKKSEAELDAELDEYMAKRNA